VYLGGFDKTEQSTSHHVDENIQNSTKYKYELCIHLLQQLCSNLYKQCAFRIKTEFNNWQSRSSQLGFPLVAFGFYTKILNFIWNILIVRGWSALLKKRDNDFVPNPPTHRRYAETPNQEKRDTENTPGLPIDKPLNESNPQQTEKRESLTTDTDT